MSGFPSPSEQYLNIMLQFWFSRWVSGVITVHHPLVWAACVTYIHSAGLTDRVWGEGDTFVVLVYCKGQTQPSFWECRLSDNLLGRKEDTPPFEISTGEVDIQFQKVRDQPYSGCGLIKKGVLSIVMHSCLGYTKVCILGSSIILIFVGIHNGTSHIRCHD